MAGRAMVERLGEIRSPVPLGVVIRRRLEAPRTEEQQLPAGLQRANSQWRNERVRDRQRTHRPLRHDEGVDRVDVVVADLGEMVIGEGRKEV